MNKKSYQLITIIKSQETQEKSHLENVNYLNDKKNEIISFLQSNGIVLNDESKESQFITREAYPFKKHKSGKVGFLILRSFCEGEEINKIRNKIRRNLPYILCFRVIMVDKKLLLTDYVI